jgi:hypothetical protein
LTVVSTAVPTMITKKKKTAAAASSLTSTQGATNGGNPAGSWTSLQAEVDGATTEELLKHFALAIENNVWDRRNQMINHTLALRAVVACASDPNIQRESIEKKAISRNDIMKWIDDSDVFGVWSEKIQLRVENKTHIANITKVLLKAGYERTASAGRNIRWKLPRTAGTNVNKSESEEKEVAEEGLDNHGGGGADDDGASHGQSDDGSSEEDDEGPNGDGNGDVDDS